VTAWDDARRRSLADGVVARCYAEFGQAWHVSAEAAAPEQCVLMERAVDSGTLEALESLAESDTDRDKWILLVVRVVGPGPSLVAVEYDLASRRWSDGPVRQIDDWQRLEPLAFESLADVCSSQALVKSVTGPQIILRLRGGLLPVQNPRRAAGGVGSVFEIVGKRTRTFARVERRDGHLLECRIVGQPLPDQPASEAKGTMAVQVRALHTSTEMAFHLDAGDTRSPLVGCEVWTSRQRNETGQFVGRTDVLGRVQAVRDDSGVVWLHLRQGPVVLESLPVVPGYCQTQRIVSHVRPESLQVAELLALCSDDLAELVALRETIRARVKAREAASQTDQANALDQAGKELLAQRVDALHLTWQRRKSRAEQLIGTELPSVAAAWKQLIGELNALRPNSEANSAE
jgi:hypothetical protein